MKMIIVTKCSSLCLQNNWFTRQYYLFLLVSCQPSAIPSFIEITNSPATGCCQNLLFCMEWLCC